MVDSLWSIDAESNFVNFSSPGSEDEGDIVAWWAIRLYEYVLMVVMACTDLSDLAIRTDPGDQQRACTVDVLVLLPEESLDRKSVV